MKTVVYIVTCVVALSVVSCTSRQKGGDDVQVLMQDSTVTSAPQRSHLPFTTSSFAKPVLQDGHQLIGNSFSYASPSLNIFTKIHCVHL